MPGNNSLVGRLAMKKLVVRKLEPIKTSANAECVPSAA
jgi:hypothetical protein